MKRLSLLIALSLSACGQPKAAMEKRTQSQSAHGVGKASWYASGSRTASGAPFKPNGLSAAHRTMAFGTRVRFTNLANGRSIVAVVNDRGPFIPGRTWDVSRGAAVALGMLGAGTAVLKWEVVK